jgi:hypothetical protein
LLLTGFGFSGSSSLDSKPHSRVEAHKDIASLRTVISFREVWAAFLFISLYTGAGTYFQRAFHLNSNVL